MKIAMLSPIAWRTPPRHYGPWENVVSLLTEGLVDRGFEVTLFATADSQTRGKLHAVCRKGYEEDPSINPKVWECLHISELFEQAQAFDVIHNHFDFLPLTYSSLVDTPVITTIHGFSSPDILPVYEKYNGKVYYVSISNADRASHLDYVATVYHGIDLRHFTFRADPGDYLLFFGRIHHDKGTREAITVAQRCRKKLIIAGIIQDREYFARCVEPLLDGQTITFVGSANPSTRDRLLGNAFALLHPIQFDEPFGLSVIESMACGTPVVAFNRGSMPELIEHGKTGFLVSTVDEAVDALSKVGSLDRKACRAAVEARFTVDHMVENYIKVYQRVVEERGAEHHRPWGYYQVLSDAEDYKAKKIVVYPGQRLSLQRHQRRAEHWYILKGRAKVILNQEEFELKERQSVDIPRGSFHRIENVGSDDLSLVEVQTGEYFGEDDIERIEDDYGRV